MNPFPPPVLWALPVAALALAAVWRPWRPAPVGLPAPWMRVLVALSIGLCALVAYYVQYQFTLPAMPPVRPQHWMAWGVLAAAPLALLEVRGRAARVSLHVLWAAIWAAVVWFAGTPLRDAPWHAGGGLLGAAFAVAVGVVCHSGGRIALARLEYRGPLEALALLLWCMGCAVVLGLGGYAGGAYLIGAGCTVVGGVWVIGMLRPSTPVLHGLWGPLALHVSAMLFMGANYNELGDRRAALGLLLVPLGLLCFPVTRWGGWARLALIAALTAACVYFGWPEPEPEAAPWY